jgi:hypothetical protein
MALLDPTTLAQLLANGERQQSVRGTPQEIDFHPVVKLFTPDAGATWLLTEVEPDDPDIAFGLCDLGLGYPELGSVRISDLEKVRGRFGLPVERDLHFRASSTLREYVAAARRCGRIKA